MQQWVWLAQKALDVLFYEWEVLFKEMRSGHFSAVPLGPLIANFVVFLTCLYNMAISYVPLTMLCVNFPYDANLAFGVFIT